MKNIIKKIKSNRVLFILLFITIISIIFGVLFLAIQNSDIKKQVNINLSDILSAITNNKYNSFKVLFNSLKSNLLIGILIWLLGISIIGIPLILIAYIIKCIMLGFTISSFIYFYTFKGVLLGFIYLIPSIINIFILFVLVYYAIRFSLLLFENVFKRKDYNKRVVVKRYVKVLIISIILLLISSVIEGYVIPILLKLINF